MAQVVRGGCAHDCPDTCAWHVTVEGGTAVKLVGDPDHPYTHGALCAKVNRYLDRVYAPDRVLRPLRRAGAKGEGRFEEVTWDVALHDISARLRQVVDEHGAQAILPYSYAGNMGLVQYRGMDRRFFGRLGASRLDRTICGDTANAGVSAVLGTSTGMLPEEIELSRLIVLWGTNTVVTNVHLWPLVRRARAAGAQVIAIDPVRTRTVAEADRWIQPLPGSDPALVLGLLRLIADEGLEDSEYLRQHSTGWETLRRRLAEWPVERAASVCGVPVDEIVWLAHSLARERPACIRTLVGPEKHPTGAATFSAIATLPAVLGLWREAGGGLLHWTREVFETVFDTRAVTRPDLAVARTRKISMIQVGRALNDVDLDPPVQALVVYNSNPAAIAPNAGLVRQGLERADLFTVVSDLFVTDTARYADYVLPATSFIEHWDLLFPWGHTYAVLNRPAIDPVGESVSNGELFRRLSAAMGFEGPDFTESDRSMVRRAVPDELWPELEERGWARMPMPEPPLHADGGFPTDDGRCRLWAGEWAMPPPPGPEPLVMVSAKYGLHFLNTSYSHLPRHARPEGEPHVVINADDAALRGIRDGNRVFVRNARGCLELVARVGEDVRPGVVAVPHGYWGAAAANLLTTDGLSDVGGGADFYSTRVEVERI